jgi:hypothetical protein
VITSDISVYRALFRKKDFKTDLSRLGRSTN